MQVSLHLNWDICWTKHTAYKTHRRFPDCVVATRAHRILFNNHKTIRSYNNWHWADEHRNKPSLALMATGVGGVLYPPRCMNEELLNQKLFLKLSPNADDLWLKVMQIRKGTKVVLCDRKVSHKRADIQGTQEQSLNSSNVHKCVNDEYMDIFLIAIMFCRKDQIWHHYSVGRRLTTHIMSSSWESKL